MKNVIGRNSLPLAYNGKLMYRDVNQPFTLRFEFDTVDYDPTEYEWVEGSYWTKVEGVTTNRWDWHYSEPDWTNAFVNRFLHGVDRPYRVVAGNTHGVTNMSGLFFGCHGLNGVSWFDTSTVTDMSKMFRLTAIHTAPLYDTSHVVNMNEMFMQCDKLVSVPLLDTSMATNMAFMFAGCESLAVIPPFNTSSATDMSGCFRNCYSATSFPVFDTHNVTQMWEMFAFCTSLVEGPALNTSNVTTAAGMFWGCSSLVRVPIYDTANIGEMSDMFEDCASLVQIPLFNLSSARGFRYMFRNCVNVESNILAFYNNAKDIVDSHHEDTFENCGSNTTTGAAELAQIPDDWK